MARASQPAQNRLIEKKAVANLNGWDFLVKTANNCPVEDIKCMAGHVEHVLHYDSQAEAVIARLMGMTDLEIYKMLAVMVDQHDMHPCQITDYLTVFLGPFSRRKGLTSTGRRALHFGDNEPIESTRRSSISDWGGFVFLASLRDEYTGPVSCIAGRVLRLAMTGELTWATKMVMRGLGQEKLTGLANQIANYDLTDVGIVQLLEGRKAH